MVYRIAVCDSESVICKTIYDMIKAVPVPKNIRFEIDCFTSGEDLCEEMTSCAYDLIFLDIELPQMNGIAVGKYIREDLNNETVQIAYISSKQQYAMELFEIRPINFLLKPITSDKAQKIIYKFLKLNSVDTQIFKFKVRQEYIKIPLSEIIYFSNHGRTVTLVSKNKSYAFYGTLDDIYNKLKIENFLYIHKSFIVNYRYVRRYEYEQITLLDGKVLPISQPRRKPIRTIISKIDKIQ